MRRKVKRLLRKHGYPPDRRVDAVATLMGQAERVGKDWNVRVRVPPPPPSFSQIAETRAISEIRCVTWTHQGHSGEK